MINNPPSMWTTWVQSLGLEEGMAYHSSILAWRIPPDRRAWRATVHGVAESRTRLRAEAQQFCFLGCFPNFIFLPLTEFVCLVKYSLIWLLQALAAARDMRGLVP